MLVRPRGLFASGKFDQYKRNIPYSRALAQAFQSSGPSAACQERGRVAPLAALREAMAESIVHYVVRTKENVNVSTMPQPRIRSLQMHTSFARSILCLPLVNQAKLIAVLYLENNLAPHVFTSTRIAVLKLLASQTAICLENTRLYRGLEEREAKIRRLVNANIIWIFVWNLEGGIIEANEAFLHMLRFSREDLIWGAYDGLISRRQNGGTATSVP